MEIISCNGWTNLRKPFALQHWPGDIFTMRTPETILHFVLIFR
ncbi:MAG: hypothetical protein ACFFC3_01530 [Candidatus Odinarchaeota archaeon]